MPRMRTISSLVPQAEKRLAAGIAARKARAAAQRAAVKAALGVNVAPTGPGPRLTTPAQRAFEREQQALREQASNAPPIESDE